MLHDYTGGFSTMKELSLAGEKKSISLNHTVLRGKEVTDFPEVQTGSVPYSNNT